MSIRRSKTTQNVAGAGVAAGTATVSIVAAIRAFDPPWPVEADAAIVTVANVVVIPLLSRAIAFRRDPRKRWY
jgi:hypothetical protein